MKKTAKMSHEYVIRALILTIEFPSQGDVSQSRKQPVLFDIAKLQPLLDTSYDFKIGLFKHLSLTDLAHAVEALKLELTEVERAKYFNPARAIFEHQEHFQQLQRQGWGITLFGRHTKKVLQHLMSPSKQLDHRCPTCLESLKLTCFILLTSPVGRSAGKYTSTDIIPLASLLAHGERSLWKSASSSFAVSVEILHHPLEEHRSPMATAPTWGDPGLVDLSNDLSSNGQALLKILETTGEVAPVDCVNLHRGRQVTEAIIEFENRLASSQDASGDDHRIRLSGRAFHKPGSEPWSPWLVNRCSPSPTGFTHWMTAGGFSNSGSIILTSAFCIFTYSLVVRVPVHLHDGVGEEQFIPGKSLMDHLDEKTEDCECLCDYASTHGIRGGD